MKLFRSWGCGATLLFAALLAWPGLHAADVNPTAEPVVKVDDTATAMRKLRVPEGMKVELFAAEPMIKNVVSFAFDEKGRCFVVESGRRRTSVYDIRNHKDWLDIDFSLRTVDDRINFLKSVLTPTNTALPSFLKVDRNGDGVFDWHDLEVESERVRLLEDTDGDGKPDKATTFADGFNSIVSGVAAGVLAHRGNVYFTCIPDLWLLRDPQGKGTATARQKLLSGFGVHIAFGGHDMHGLRMGPDGKIYFSIADRGMSVVAHDHLFSVPDSGSVMRCDPDGSNFEIVASGLRNPQELVFDEFGNLWTGDNNGDGGDPARWVYVAEGGDSGWTMGWQWLPKMGAWNSEKLWGIHGENTAAYIVPPIAHIGHGPAGITYYPGTGLPDRFTNSFFYSDFPGGIRHFRTKPQGASFTVEDEGPYLKDNAADNMKGKVLWNLEPTDVDFGPQPGIYVSDWVQGWDKTGAGRIFRVFDPVLEGNAESKQVRELLAGDWSQLKLGPLVDLMGHKDQRVRQEAQFEMVSRGGTNVVDLLTEVLKRSSNRFQRLHTLWALGILARTDAEALRFAVHAISDVDPEIRAQSAKLCGDLHSTGSYNRLVERLKDGSPRVQYFSAISLGKIGNPGCVPMIIRMLQENDDKDPMLRHAGIMALSHLEDIDALLTAAQSSSAAVRLAAAVALRSHNRPEIMLLLNDKDPRVMLEAVRAVNDAPIPAVLPQLAELTASAQLGEPILRRALNANYRLGELENASRVVALAGHAAASESVRLFALELLGDWINPPVRDKIVGLWRPLPKRELATVGPALLPAFESLINSTSGPVSLAAVQAGEKLGMREAAPFFVKLVEDAKRSSQLRAAALKALAGFKIPGLDKLVELAFNSTAETLRQAAVQIKAESAGRDPLQFARELLGSQRTSDIRAGLHLTTLAKGVEADETVLVWLKQLTEGKLSPALELDVYEAAQARDGNQVKNALRGYDRSVATHGKLAKYWPVLQGGNAEEGRRIFVEKAEVGCYRCHKVQGEGGQVGPEVTNLGKTRSREYLLESILYPNAAIAPGFEQVNIVMKNGAQYTGVLKKESDQELEVSTGEDGVVKVSKSDIKSRERGQSPMPEGLGEMLSKQELRDLVEFLATVR